MFPVKRLMDIVARFAAARVVVVGDLIADEYLYGKPARISREAPVLILRFAGRDVKLGGAANAAHNVHALGASALAVGVRGKDGAGDEVALLLRQAGIAPDGLVTAAGRLTPVKTRIMAGGDQSTRHQVVRLDREPDNGLPPDVEDEVIRRLRALGARADAFLVSDYGYGTVTPRVFEVVLALGRARGAPVAVDSRYDLPRFRGATAATPNEPEVETLVGEELGDEPSIEKAGRAVLERLGARYLLVTRGSRGMALFEREGPATFMPIHGSDEIADVTGAGDTVISAFTVALAAGAPPGEAAWLANVAGGVVVMKRGTATVTPRELADSLSSDGAARQP
ncbi:MAG TPA: PfkB family carbohydrate kinase [Methylomirabilota bacterium]|jgi:rfaE bifunctional protein kinase chain/domain|nr:PfkB family carbohydrate kinase [Methylomirabilota bacterium]